MAVNIQAAPGKHPRTKMAASRLGSWRKPPLAYVVAEVRFSALLTVERHAPDFQALVRPNFPRAREGMAVKIEVLGTPMAGQEKVWQFLSENQRSGIHLSKTTVALHATEYRDFPMFRSSLNELLKAAETSIPDLFVEQLGLRYIDYILPVEGESCFDYIVESLRGVRPPGTKEPDEAYWIARFQFPTGNVNLRVMPRLPAGTFQPPNFGPLDLVPSDVQREAQRRAQLNEPVGCIDTDRIMPVGTKLDAEALGSAFDGMHDDVSSVFKAAISKKAEEVWI